MFKTILTAFRPTTIDLENWLLFAAVVLVALAIGLAVSASTDLARDAFVDFWRGL